MMRPQHIDNHSVASIRPNCSESSMHTDQSTISVIPSHLINLGHSPQIMLQQQHQQQVQQQPLYSTPILQSSLNIIQTELIRSGLQNSNLISSNPASLDLEDC
ncbi:unnamed protein product [Heterobilharzia americana]|nr:unnamed protein product [Heterobilharzia americana]